MFIYSNPADKHDPHKLPDVEILELTAEEVAAADDDMVWEYMRRREFQLAAMNSSVRDAMLAAMVEENGITGAWVFRFCTPGCMPDSDHFGYYSSAEDAAQAARDFVDA
jgi:hypothetical protein